VVNLLSPIPLAAGMAILSGTLSSLANGSILVIGFGVASSVLLLVTGLRSNATEVEAQGRSPEGALSIGGGTVLYLLGSYYGQAIAHWAAILILYNGLVLYLGGRYLLKVVLPPSLALFTLALPQSVPLEAATILFLTMGDVVSAATLLGEKSNSPPLACVRQEHHTNGAGAYCVYCGNKVGKTTINLGGRRLAKVAVLSAVLLISSAVPVQVITSQNGAIYSSNYALSGLVSKSPLATTDGWALASSQTTVQGNLGFSRSVLTDGGHDVVVVTTISPSGPTALGALSNAFPTTSPGGTVSFFGNSTSSQLLLESTNSTFRGLKWTSNIYVFNGASLQRETIAYLAVEALSSTTVSGTGLYKVTSSTLTELQATQGWNPLVSRAVNAWQIVGSYLSMAGAIFLVALPFEAARRRDLETARSIENVLGLSVEEQAVLALMSASSKPMTGREIMELVREQSGYSHRYPFENLLLKLERLGLVRGVVHKGRRESFMLWKCEVRS
jgi:hypothetical protein